MSSKKDPNRVSHKDIVQGDIIQFESHMERVGTPPANTNIGLVIDFIKDRKTDDIAGFEIFPLKAYSKDQFIQNDNEHYMISKENDIIDIDLDPTQNYRVQFKSHIIPNHGVYLNEDKKGGVVRRGSAHATPLFGFILDRANRSEINLSKFFRGSTEISRLQGGRKETPTQKIIDSQSVEQGKNIHVERERQDSYDSTVISSKVSNTESKTRRTHKKRKGTDHKDGIVKDITIEDAKKIKLINADVAKGLSTEFDKRRTKPLTTLGQFSDLAINNPKALKKLANTINMNPDELKLSITTAHAKFLTDMNNGSMTAYKNVDTDFDEDHNPITTPD